MIQHPATLALLVGCLLSSIAADGPKLRRRLMGGGILTSDDKDVLLDDINEYRSKTAKEEKVTNMNELVWDASLAKEASERASECTFSALKSGEIAYFSASSVDANDNISTLKRYLERINRNGRYYNSDDNTCSRRGSTCPVYKQMMLATSTTVGCGYSRCNGPDVTQYWVNYPFAIVLFCKFDVAQNDDEKPYQKANSQSMIASNCPVGYSKDILKGLCVSGAVGLPQPVPPSPTPLPTLSSAPSSSPVVVPVSDDQAKILDRLNLYRSQTALGMTKNQPKATNMTQLVWDQGLASSATARAEACSLYAGEGAGVAATALMSAAYDIDTVLDSVEYMYERHEYYNYDKMACEGGVCGPYTQMVWSKTFRVGCGYALCDAEKVSSNFKNFPYALLVFCRYDPPGNDDGQHRNQKPYGRAITNNDIASKCPAGFQANKASGLCLVPGGQAPPPPPAPPAPSPNVSPSSMSSDETKMLNRINEHRRETALGNTPKQPPATNMTKLVWDHTLASSATEKAAKCELVAGGGEAISATGSDREFKDVTNALLGRVDRMFSYHERYNYDTNSCPKGYCSLYTQMMWSETERVGCGYARCGKEIHPGFANTPFVILVVCKYDPPSNDRGQDSVQWPYGDATSGGIASECPMGYSAGSGDDNGLCVPDP